VLAGLVPPWWLVLFPGGAITLTVLAFSLLGDASAASSTRARGARW
jgi:ABC-type dipeptide/oligopeptide/nickel transport system permease subunit